MMAAILRHQPIGDQRIERLLDLGFMAGQVDVTAESGRSGGDIGEGKDTGACARKPVLALARDVAGVGDRDFVAVEGGIESRPWGGGAAAPPRGQGAVDRREIVEGYLYGFGTPADGPVPPDVPGYLPVVTSRAAAP